MKKHARLIIIILAVICILGLIIVHLRSKHQRDIDQTVSVAVSTAQQKDATVFISTIGTVTAYNSVSVKSLVTGQLLSVGFDEGAEVKQGQVLFKIDPKPYQAALDQAIGSLARDQAQLTNAQLTLKRDEPLRQKGYLSQQDYDAATSAVAQFTAMVKTDTAAVANAQLNLDYCTITSPINGRVGKQAIDPGNLVRAGDTTALTTINQISPISVAFAVPENYLTELQQAFAKGTVPITAKFNQQLFTGNLVFIDNTVNTDTGTIQMKATFANKDEKLWPGAFVKVTIPVAHLTQAISVPTLAVQEGQQGAYVFVIKDQTAQLRPVTTGPILDHETVITRGLQAGEQVVTEGILRLHDGSPVQIKSATSDVKSSP